MGADRGAADDAADGGDVLAGAAADLVAEDAAEDAADHRAGHVVLALSGSATCWRSTQQRCSGVPTTARTEVTGASAQALVRAAAVFIRRVEHRLRLVLVLLVSRSTGRTEEIWFSSPMLRSES